MYTASVVARLVFTQAMYTYLVDVHHVLVHPPSNALTVHVIFHISYFIFPYFVFLISYFVLRVLHCLACLVCLCVFLCVCVYFPLGIPILYLCAALTFTVSYWADKYLFLRFYRMPPLYDGKLGLKYSKLLPWGALGHLLVAMWMYVIT